MRVQIDKVKTVIESRITEDGRIYGLKKYKGHQAKIVVLENNKKPVK